MYLSFAPAGRTAEAFFLGKSSLSAATAEAASIGVDFDTRGGVASFLRTVTFRVVALCLAVRGFSPLTAPFSTLSFGDAAHSSTPGALKTVEPFKPGLDKLVVLPALLPRSADSHLVWIVLSLSRIVRHTPATLHAILRI